MRIAMIGARGVPATYGGIERHVEELGSRLAARGHEVTVYCRPNYAADLPAEHRGMRLRIVATAGTKHLDAIVHSALSSAAAMREGHDVLHYHAVGPALLAGPARVAGRRAVVATVHGLDSERGKWGRGASAVLKTAEWSAVRIPHQTIVVSQELRRHFGVQHGRSTTYIANGVSAPVVAPGRASLLRWGIADVPFLLFVGRLVPEKAPEQLVRAFRTIPGDVRLVVAGGSSFSDDYVARVREAADDDPRVLLPGYVYGQQLAELYAGAAAFVLPSAVEGLPLTLLEAIAHGAPVVASDIPPHREVLGETDAAGARQFEVGDSGALCAALQRSLDDPTRERAAATRLRESVLARYSWDHATDQTELLYEQAARRRDARNNGSGTGG